MPELTINHNAIAEIQHLKEQESLVQRIRAYYLAVLAQINPLIEAKAPRSVINRKLNASLRDMVRKTTAAIESASSKSWEIANDRTADLVQQKYKGMDLPKAVQEALNDHRGKALKQFISRKENGLNLSERVWKTAKQYQDLINTNLEEGIKEGKPAREISKKIRSALESPNTQDKPGQGVYKSPVKNAERVGRTEVNMSYRMSDQKAWEDNPLVLGYEINLSATGKPKVRCELCRKLTGRYPVTFVFVGWHPHCLCFKTPILMSREMLDAYNKLIAQGKDTPDAVAKLQAKVRVTDVPNAFNEWVTGNVDRVNGWKSKPYWWKDNQDLIDSLLTK